MKLFNDLNEIEVQLFTPVKWINKTKKKNLII